MWVVPTQSPKPGRWDGARTFMHSHPSVAPRRHGVHGENLWAYDDRMEIIVQPIGVVRNKVEGKREDHWGRVDSEIHLDSERFTDEALVGLDEFSHVEVIFQFHFIAENTLDDLC